MNPNQVTIDIVDARDHCRAVRAVQAAQRGRVAKRRRRWSGNAAASEVAYHRAAARALRRIPDPTGYLDAALIIIGARQVRTRLTAKHRTIEQPTPTKLDQHVTRVTAGPAFDDQPALAVAERERRAAATMHRAATSPPCA
jgi:hypothetical protein